MFFYASLHQKCSLKILIKKSHTVTSKKNFFFNKTKQKMTQRSKKDLNQTYKTHTNRMSAKDKKRMRYVDDYIQQKAFAQKIII